jgi:predicted DNA-binding protein
MTIQKKVRLRVLPRGGFSRTLKAMEVRFPPEMEKKLSDLVTQSGRGTDELVQDAMAGYLDELVQSREMLNGRYDDLKSGSVKPMDGEEAFARLKAKTEAQRNRPA